MKNSTLMPHLAAKAAARHARACADLSFITDLVRRARLAHEMIHYALQDAALYVMAPEVRDAIGRAMAVLEAMKAIDAKPAEFFHDRDNPVCEPVPLPPGIEGWAIGRVSR